jgi:maltose alpha-D-glucosyltransferase/alpha-amylase
MKNKILIVAILIAVVALYFIFFQHKKVPQVPDNTTAFLHTLNEERITAHEPSITNIDSSLWYKNSVIYTLDVKVFKDSDGDGIGDFKGLTSKLDYIKSLGMDIIWLAPFYPTPAMDDGYDITDYYKVEPRLGTMEDFQQFVGKANGLGIKVIIDLVFNHTSIQHSWFQQARDTNNNYHAWYVWSKERPENIDKSIVFEGVQKDIWTYDSTAKEYYNHSFYNFEPDLNLQNQQVKNELWKVMNYWLKTGISGFRIDAVTYLTQIPQTKGEDFKYNYDLLNQMRSLNQSANNKNVLLGEASVSSKKIDDFFGKEGERLNIVFNFYADQCLFYSLATEDGSKFKSAMNENKQIPLQCGWVYFLRNQDEMGMGKLSKKEQEKVFDAFGPQKNMQLYNRGVRLRLAPMFKNDQQRIRMAYSLMFSLPGDPMIRYGDEIGMGSDLNLKERLAVRTPMQWNDSISAGFSSSIKTIRPVIKDGAFGYPNVNVQFELSDSSSLLNWMIKMIHLRKSLREITWGNWNFIETNSSHVIAMRYDWNEKSIITLHNLSNQPQQVKLKFNDDVTRLQSLINGNIDHIHNNNCRLFVKGYGYNWYIVN